MKNTKIYTDIRKIVFEEPIASEYLDGYDQTVGKYQFRLTEHMRHLINKTNHPALKKQFLPTTQELLQSSTEFLDVSDEVNYEPVPYITHRYPGKVLLSLTLNCHTFCRFCFRKEKLNNPIYKKFITDEQLDDAINYIIKQNINEVIFSGGDPFFCSNELIERAVDKLVHIPKVQIVRYHTRAFTFDPNRITSDLLSIIQRKKTAFIVIHINQVEEISAETEKAISLCVDNGIPLFSQTALLKGVNDTKDAMEKLLTKLIQLRVKPYYLFHSDPGHGLGHFRVKLNDGVALYRGLYDRISGLAMPIYLFNIPGGYGHVILDLGNVRQIGSDEYELTNWQDEKIIYKDY